MYPEGKYRVKVTHQAVGVSAQKKTPQVVLTVKPVSYEGGDGNEEFNFERKIYLYLTENTKDFVTRDLLTAGFSGKVSQLDPDSKDHVSLVGNEFPALCKHEVYNEKDQERWSIYSKKEAEPADADTLADLDALFGEIKKEDDCPI